MFGTIRKHQTWLWFIIIGVMILSMALFTQMNGSGNKQRASGEGRGVIYGRPVTEAEYREGRNDAVLRYFLSKGEWPNSATSSDWNEEIETYRRVFLDRKLEQYDIHANSDLVAERARSYLRIFGRGQDVPLDVFEQQILRPQGLSAADFEHVLEQDISLEQLTAIVGASGKLITPAELQALYIQEHQELKVDAVFFATSNFLAGISEPTPAALGQFFTNEEAEYREPDQMQLRYLRFNVTNYLAGAQKEIGSNITSQTAVVFSRLDTNMLLQLGATESEQKEKISESLIRQTAFSNANLEAVAFQRNLVSKEPVRADNLDALAKEKGMEVKVTKPFNKDYGPNEMRFPPKFPISDLFNLTADDPFVESPVAAQDGVYLFAFDKFIPSRVPPLDDIRDKVIADYKYVQAQQMAQMRGEVFAQLATNGLASGRSFSAISTEAKMTPTELPPLSESTETLPHVEDRDLTALKQAAFNTPVGKSSVLMPLSTGGVVVYVRERLPIDQAKMAEELPEFSKAVRRQRANEAFEIWFGKEASTVLRDIPSLQQYSQQPRS